MVKKIFFCLFAAGLVMNNFAMEDRSDSDDEKIDRTPKNVAIVFGKGLSQTFVLDKEDIKNKRLRVNDARYPSTVFACLRFMSQ